MKPTLLFCLLCFFQKAQQFDFSYASGFPKNLNADQRGSLPTGNTKLGAALNVPEDAP